MNRQQILYSMFYDMRTQAPVAVVAPDRSAMAMYSPGKPLWLWARSGWDKTVLCSFFYALLQTQIKLPLTGIISAVDVARECAGLYVKYINATYKTRGLVAYYWPSDATGQGERLYSAAACDAAILSEWIAGFYAEALEAAPPFEERAAVATHIKNDARLYVLRDKPTDAPLAMGMLGGRSGETRRLNLIYTPPALRGRGYGKRITLALAAMARKEGYTPVLYTAADNGRANHMYRSLGFVEAGCLSEVTFFY